MIVSVQQGELLADAEPGLLLPGLVHDLVAGVSVVCLCWFLVVFRSLTKNNLIVSQSEGIPVQRHGVEIHVGVVPLGQVGTAPVKTPDRQLSRSFGHEPDSLGLAPETLPSAIYPDVGALDLVL